MARLSTETLQLLKKAFTEDAMTPGQAAAKGRLQIQITAFNIDLSFVANQLPYLVEQIGLARRL